jgi:hypothetical protein
MIDRIKEIIEKENLKQKTKKPNKVHRRWFLFKLLRKNNVTYKGIAEMFNMNHATIIYGMQQVEKFEKQKDEIYLLDTKDLNIEFNNVEIILKERDLFEDILNCNNLQALTKIKCRIDNGIYKQNKNL